MFNLPLFRYELSEVLESTTDEQLSENYHVFMQIYKDSTKAKELFETLAKLPREMLRQLRLEYRPRREGFYATFYIIHIDKEYSNHDYVLVKQHDCNPIRYIVR